ncbi:protein kinase [Pseudenhygromyxa sp. WMMC2535]|uniref:serine/threonine-protein kinase n=1 Tax=Pseudenhygromyxa sp. WMMC2535 TaxID=2712867 RepID=UPI0015572637|nr:serine/threonine-protein kinase [Pseudenhygromyxa sp. WMMC2535]NVB37830.1 protein kinase [Pseudenhygromyxa sp. WMMC2535]
MPKPPTVSNLRRGASTPPNLPKRTMVGRGPKPSESASAPQVEVPPQPSAQAPQPPRAVAPPSATPKAAASSPTLIAAPGSMPGQRGAAAAESAAGMVVETTAESMAQSAAQSLTGRQLEAPLRPTEEDFQARRHEHRGTQMSGIEHLSEPGADQPRVRLVPGKAVPGTRYRILRWLGEGGMGVVYEAEHIDIERKVALKILRFDLSQEAQMAQVFRDEARAASRVGSRNIVEIYDFGELADGRLFFCMELIPGGDLVPISQDDWIEPPRLLGLLRQVCKGLAAAHKVGVIHRDIKPENIIAVNEEGREVVKIVDFGISAMVAAGSQGQTNIAGTPHYMAPEQITGKEFDGRLDIYSVGCMAYELLVGVPPFDDEDIQKLLEKQLKAKPQPLTEVRPEREIPQALSDVIMKCLAKDPEDRWQDMVDLEAALCEAQIAAGLTTPWDDLPLPDVDPERRARLVHDMPNPNTIVLEQGNRWLLPLLAGIGALLIGVGVTWVLVGGDPTPEEVDMIDQLSDEAHLAGAKTQWVYPPATDPGAPTSYQKVIALENLTGSAEEPGDERASELREEFFETLRVLGDRYWDVPGARNLSRDYYAMAHLFKPEDELARARSGWSISELADFRERAAAGEFTPDELSVARLLDAFAEEDEALLGEKLEELLAGQLEGRSLLAMTKAIEAARGIGVEVDPLPGFARTPEEQPVEVGEDEGEEAGEEAGEDEGEVVEEGSKKGGRKGGRKSETLGGSGRNPGKAADLASEGEAALRAGKRTEAKSLFDQAISYDNSNAKALMGLSDVYFDTGGSQKALLYAEKAVKAAPRNSNYRIKLGDAYYKALRYRDALEQYERAKSLGASKADARIDKVQEKIGK